MPAAFIASTCPAWVCSRVGRHDDQLFFFFSFSFSFSFSSSSPLPSPSAVAVAVWAAVVCWRGRPVEDGVQQGDEAGVE